MDEPKSAYVSVCKTNFTDDHRPDIIHDFRNSVLVCKMHDMQNISSISIPSHQAMQTIALVRLYEWKQTTFKRI